MLTVRIYTSIIHLARAREYALLDDDDDGECACVRAIAMRRGQTAAVLAGTN